jgi:hypothetical protein
MELIDSYFLQWLECSLKMNDPNIECFSVCVRSILKVLVLKEKLFLISMIRYDNEQIMEPRWSFLR